MTPCSSGRIEFIDLTLRDGQQSLLATRMSGAQVLRLMPLILDTGMKTMEVWGGATLDSAMRYLDEDPFERLERMTETAGSYECRLRALSRGQNLFGYDPYPDDIVKDFNREAVQSGVEIMRIFDALNYIPNFRAALEGTREAGGAFDAAICYTTGDPYDIDHFVGKALELQELGADMITDKDMAGLKEPSVAWQYYTALKEKLDVPVVSHTHCTPGFGHISAVIAMLAGVEMIDTCFLPLAGGASHPSVELLSVFTDLLGIETGLDLSKGRIEPLHTELRQVIGEVEQEFSVSTHETTWPGRDTLAPMAEEVLRCLSEGRTEDAIGIAHGMEDMCGFPPPNEEVRKAQIPGGMYSNFTTQLEKDGKSDCLSAALDAVQSVRKKAGWCPLVTPTSQIVGVKAYLVALGKNVNPVQYENLVAGYYGETPFPVDKDYREEICGFRDERRYDSSDFSREIPLLEGTDLPLAETPHEKLLYYLFPDSSGRAFLEKRRRKEWAVTVRKRENLQEDKEKKLKDQAIINRYADEMDLLSEELSDALEEAGSEFDKDSLEEIADLAKHADEEDEEEKN
ncbi:MAG: carboxylase [Candidatus Aegiribacteria sp.]|nr:carboxylase [Candidatus Aegiribacteria sp.]